MRSHRVLHDEAAIEAGVEEEGIVGVGVELAIAPGDGVQIEDS